MSVAIQHVSIERTDLVTKRTHAKVMREVLRGVAVHHVNVTMGKHFKEVPETMPGGAYGYVKRDPKYTEKKKRTFGHSLPNVRTGKLRRSLRNNSVVRATQHKSTIQVKGYFPLNAQRAKELTAITEQESNDMQVRAIDRYAREIAKPENQRKRKKRI